MTLLEILKLIIPPLAAVLFAGLIGNWLSARWHIWQKQRESSLIAVAEFTRLYGEFSPSGSSGITPFTKTWSCLRRYLGNCSNALRQQKRASKHCLFDWRRLRDCLLPRSRSQVNFVKLINSCANASAITASSTGQPTIIHNTWPSKYWPLHSHNC